MDVVFVTAFAFAVGLTFAGLAGTMIELVSGERLSFAHSFRSKRHAVLSLVAAVLVGPYMLVNDAIEARRNGDVPLIMLAACLVTAAVWLTAAGVVAVDLALRLSGPLT